MSIALGIDIGGTKVAVGSYDQEGRELAQVLLPTSENYEALLETCRLAIAQVEQKGGKADTYGACAPYADDSICANVPYLVGKNLRKDLEAIVQHPMMFANDANCAALAEAMEGAGKGYASVFGLILGTGVAGGFVVNGKIFSGANGMCGEIGHLPLPYYEDSDGERVPCGCGQAGCIEKLVAGAALARLYRRMTGKEADARDIAEQARRGDADALRVLDHYYTVLAKAMVTVLHSFDPEIIMVSGGLNALPDLYVEVPKRWGTYAVNKKPVTKFVPATFGSLAGLRGAALLGRNA